MIQLGLPLEDLEELHAAPPSTRRPPASKRRRGFAALTKEQVRAIASKGGRAAHAKGTGHRFTVEEARAAGTKGGSAPHVRRGRGRRA